ncbi:MAG: hypothetical protein K0Q43_4649 [Ramlibacter sp.]|nr:hypothetical protein [Ramlibacter sp.]
MLPHQLPAESALPIDHYQGWFYLNLGSGAGAVLVDVWLRIVSELREIKGEMRLAPERLTSCGTYAQVNLQLDVLESFATRLSRLWFDAQQTQCAVNLSWHVQAPDILKHDSQTLIQHQYPVTSYSAKFERPLER